jgi:polar amino acid transport system substrate-binding protein
LRYRAYPIQKKETAMRAHLFKAFLLSAAVAAGCTTAPPAPTVAEKSALAPTGSLRVAVFTGNPVLGSKDKASGEIKGTTVSLGRALAQQAGLPLVLLEYTSIAKMIDDAKAGTWDVAVVAFDASRRGVLEFAPPHISVDLTYLVAPGSNIRSIPEADIAGVKIAAARGAATALYLERNLKQASVATADNESAAFNLIREGKAQAYAQNRYMLLGLADGLPGARVLDDHFASAEMSMVLPKGRSEALAYLSSFVEQAKKSGIVARAINDAGLRGVVVAP